MILNIQYPLWGKSTRRIEIKFGELEIMRFINETKLSTAMKSPFSLSIDCGKGSYLLRADDESLEFGIPFIHEMVIKKIDYFNKKNLIKGLGRIILEDIEFKNEITNFDRWAKQQLESIFKLMDSSQSS